MDGMRADLTGAGVKRRWAAALAVLALLLQAFAPPGTMLARDGDGRAVIVLCTGHGPAMTFGDLIGQPGKAPKSKPDSPCAFAAHGAATEAPILAAIAVPIARAQPAPTPTRFDLVPGRGLAAPPPPSQGPPTTRL
jgi:hypothetical protein